MLNLQVETLTAANSTYSRIVKLTTKTTISLAILFGSMSMLTTACNEKDNTRAFNNVTNLAVTSFSLKNVKLEEGLDSAYFSIDLDKKLIFNADSLPKGTPVDKLVATVKFSSTVSEAIFEMSGGTTREGSVNYIENPTDSIDFTGNVVLRVKGNSDDEPISYRIKINVHQVDPDTLFWSELSTTELPSRLGSPLKQKTVESDSKIITLLQESDGSYTIATTTPAEIGHWTRTVATFGFTPAVESLAASDSKLYILDDKGELYSSDSNATGWADTGVVWKSMIGAYEGTVLGIGADGLFDQYPVVSIARNNIPANFPVKGASNLVTLSNKWTSSPVALMAGGITDSGALSNKTWAFDGTNWIELSRGGIPAIEGASLIPYYHFRPSAAGNSMVEYAVWMLTGGRLADGTLNRTTWISYDNGVNWTAGNESIQLPEEMPALSGCDNLVISSQFSANLADAWLKIVSRPYRANVEVSGYEVEWDCPYIYLFGGYDADGLLSSKIWRGVLARLTFTPII
ncbi:MAG: hypothetical protein K2M87_01750 [Muribaculaceae bacterium]|nr:hypothetical protein [Muribaculaceae bacterium]